MPARLEAWLAHPHDPATVGAPDDLLARVADVAVEQAKRAATAARQLKATANPSQEVIAEARRQSDWLLAMPALLLRPAPRPGGPGTLRRRRAAAGEEPEPEAYPQRTESISFSATLRR
eukprot:8722808-Lingulodinium_polyedra.AAC.1